MFHDQTGCSTVCKSVNLPKPKRQNEVNDLNVETAGCFTADFLLLQNAPQGQNNGCTQVALNNRETNTCLFIAKKSPSRSVTSETCSRI